jgi:oxygen-independent coproporphyrinogen-3 oxidase
VTREVSNKDDNYFKMTDGGLYIHIPFCRQACRYCDFYFTVSLRHQDEFVDKLLLEIARRAPDFDGITMGSLYLGGGTPSLLSEGNLATIIESVHRHYSLAENAEITIECNPDDLTPGVTESFIKSGMNRISIGIQSFRDEELKLMRRSHLSEAAVRAVENAAAAGFGNITVDLIYGIPGQTLAGWGNNLDRALSMPITHLSAYHLTYERGTVFEHWRKKGKILPVEEEESIAMFRLLREKLLIAGFDHYEISNFARKGMRSRHNLLYWSGVPYAGFGPSAHSFDGEIRSWNVSSLKEYMEGISRGEIISEQERPSLKERYHDYLITSLRTSDGADPEFIRAKFGGSVRKHFDSMAGSFILEGSMVLADSRLVIAPDRWLLADHIMRELFLE